VAKAGLRPSANFAELSSPHEGSLAPAGVRLMIDPQRAPGGRSLGSWVSPPWAPAHVARGENNLVHGGDTGSQTENVVPTEALLSTSIHPWWRSTMSLEMARPSPVPGSPEWRAVRPR
jgi:hypothetical protein